jgi:uncharacterized phage protein (TIGR01671 family)
MREILFRGRCLKTGKMVYGSLIVTKKWDAADNENTDDFVCTLKSVRTQIVNCHFTADVVPETVGQYIDRDDSKGVQIFEGDIIKYCERYEYEVIEEWDEERELEEAPDYWKIGVVAWMGKYDDFSFDLRDSDFEYNALGFIVAEGYQIEVIGNIHDNPEQLHIEVVNNGRL